MSEEELPKSAEEINAISSTYPIYFGVSCAFIALQFLSAMEGPSADLGHKKHSFEEILLRGTAQLLGLLFEKVQKRHEFLQENERKAMLEVMHLKEIRAEDAKANEKVMSIFAAREQSWQAERRRLLNLIQSISRELSLAKSKNEDFASDLNKRVLEEQQRIKDDFFEQEAKRRIDLEDKLRAAQIAVEELREKTNKEAQDHKAAFAELVSKQRELELEMAHMIHQNDATKQELDEVFEQREEAAAMVEKLSEEFVKVQKDLEQKGKIVSAMLRKAKQDTAEKQALLKEVKINRTKKKQAEMEAERWKSMWEGKQKKNLRESPSTEAESSRNKVTEFQQNSRHDLRTRLLEYFTTESVKGHDFQVQFLNESDDNNLDNVQEWVQLETKKYTTVLEQKHYSEIEAFSEQLRIRDEKLEALHWRLLSTEMDSKRLKSHIEGLDENLTHLRNENLKLEALLVDRERELKSLIQKENQGDQIFYEIEKNVGEIVEATICSDSFTSTNVSEDHSNDEIFEDQISKEEIEVEKIHSHTRHKSLEDAFFSVSSKLTSDGQPFLKMDFQALGVSFKIKRLKQQLQIVENLAEMQSCEPDKSDATNSSNEKKVEPKGLMQVISLLNKQLKRYQTLEEKIDSLCRRMLQLENSGTTEKIDKLEQFLEETFQLQRFMVATGQKLMELHSKIKISLTGVVEQEKSAGFNLEQFLDVVTTLFKEVQRGLEVRIARIIGDLEGTLASDGILRG